MKVKDVMSTVLVTIHKDTTYSNVVKILHENKLSGAPVVDDAGSIVGIISEKDLFKVLYPFYNSFYTNPELYVDFEDREKKIHEIKDHRIEKFISGEVTHADPETPILKIGALMLAKGISRLPVLLEGRLIGMVSREEIFNRILKNELEL